MHEDIAIPRLKTALTSFRHAPYDLDEAANAAGLADRIRDGACFGVSLEWAKEQMRRPGSNLANAGGHLTKAGTLDRAFSVQAQYEATLVMEKNNGLQLQPEIANSRAIRRILESNGFDVFHTQGGFDPEAIAGTVSAPGTHLVTLSGFNDGHTISVFSPDRSARDQRLTVFDPNGGEFKMRRDEAEYFLTALQARYNTLGWRYSRADVYSIRTA